MSYREPGAWTTGGVMIPARIMVEIRQTMADQHAETFRTADLEQIAATILRANTLPQSCAIVMTQRLMKEWRRDGLVERLPDSGLLGKPGLYRWAVNAAADSL